MSSSSSPASLRIAKLSHRYPGSTRHALQDVTLSLEPGLRLGLLGPNGAGKSTLMRLVCGYLPVQADDGVRVEVAGYDVRTQSLQVRERVGYMPEQVPLYAELRAREHLSYRARLKRVPWRGRAAEVQRVAALTGITHVLDTPILKLSRGYRQRVGLADALLGSPPLLILDEPTVGLDPNQVLDVRAMLRELGGSQTLVFSSHILAEVEALCDRVVILSQGRVVVDEPLLDALAASHVCGVWASDAATVERIVAAAFAALDRPGAPEPGAPEPAAIFESTAGGTSARIPLNVSGVSLTAEAVLAALGRASRDAGVAVLELRAGRTRLEQRFAEATGASPATTRQESGDG